MRGSDGGLGVYNGMGTHGGLRVQDGGLHPTCAHHHMPAARACPGTPRIRTPLLSPPRSPRFSTGGMEFPTRPSGSRPQVQPMWISAGSPEQSPGCRDTGGPMGCGWAGSSPAGTSQTALYGLHAPAMTSVRCSRFSPWSLKSTNNRFTGKTGGENQASVNWTETPALSQ